ncbi:MAG: hypothetical protein K6E63_07975 [Lachnospiraceae bacterium]|nr:hypothetical protein [Lachnospiraceae bacterium]
MMEEGSGRNVDGYEFIDRENGSIAQEEINRINYISSRMSEDNPEAVLSIYNKMIESNTFFTPVGLEYLRRLQAYLYKKQEIDDDRIRDIPVIVSYVDVQNQFNERKNELREERARKRRRVKTFKQEYKTSLMVNLVLIIMIIVMFLIILKSDTPNMINYEKAITNRYASWEQELTEREQKVREKESELGIQ